MVHELPDGKGIQVTPSTSEATPIEETITFLKIKLATCR